MDDDLKKQGYSKEEAYFHKLNQALIDKMKQQKLQTKSPDEFETEERGSEEK